MQDISSVWALPALLLKTPRAVIRGLSSSLFNNKAQDYPLQHREKRLDPPLHLWSSLCLWHSLPRPRRGAALESTAKTTNLYQHFRDQQGEDRRGPRLGSKSGKGDDDFELDPDELSQEDDDLPDPDETSVDEDSPSPDETTQRENGCSSTIGDEVSSQSNGNEGTGDSIMQSSLLPSSSPPHPLTIRGLIPPSHLHHKAFNNNASTYWTRGHLKRKFEEIENDASGNYAPLTSSNSESPKAPKAMEPGNSSAGYYESKVRRTYERMTFKELDIPP
ncbi:hypothetical protein NW762_004082 [Fusarium torreyae]|uniref:Uncharacterized protein n=1 Tax=Fusarium torreyae TaxID=1237075 RepID=A0A9W8VKF3_9HYPO|nr:hypothetical protein NW762_004082 [Fusarium torreyae]